MIPSAESSRIAIGSSNASPRHQVRPPNDDIRRDPASALARPRSRSQASGVGSRSADESETGRPTLGDLLYGDRSRARVPEKDWVQLVASIAAGDQFGALFGTFSIGIGGYIVLLMQAVLIAVVTAVSSRYAVNQTLDSIQ